MWSHIKDALPEINVQVMIYHEGHPEKVEDSYTMWKDGHDRTEEELRHRLSAREWYSKNPHRMAYLYQTAICGKKWMVSFPNDSRYGYIADLEDIKGWAYLTKPEWCDK